MEKVCHKTTVAMRKSRGITLGLFMICSFLFFLFCKHIQFFVTYKSIRLLVYVMRKAHLFYVVCDGHHWTGSHCIIDSVVSLYKDQRSWFVVKFTTAMHLSQSVCVRLSTQSISFIIAVLMPLTTYRDVIAKPHSHLLTSFAARENTLLCVWSQGQVGPKSKLLPSNCTIICCKMKMKTGSAGSGMGRKYKVYKHVF